MKNNDTTRKNHFRFVLSIGTIFFALNASAADLLKEKTIVRVSIELSQDSLEKFTVASEVKASTKEHCEAQVRRQLESYTSLKQIAYKSPCEMMVHNFEVEKINWFLADKTFWYRPIGLGHAEFLTEY